MTIIKICTKHHSLQRKKQLTLVACKTIESFDKEIYIWGDSQMISRGTLDTQVRKNVSEKESKEKGKERWDHSWRMLLEEALKINWGQIVKDLKCHAKEITLSFSGQKGTLKCHQEDLCFRKIQLLNLKENAVLNYR